MTGAGRRMAVAMVCGVATACSSGGKATDDQPRDSRSAMLVAAARAARTDDRTAAIPNTPAGADYPAAIAMVRASGRPANVIDLEVGQLVTAAYRDPKVMRMPRETMADGVGALERAAAAGGETGGIAAHWLELLFERGLWKGGRFVLAPDAELATCWHDVAAGRSRIGPAGCMIQRTDASSGVTG